MLRELAYTDSVMGNWSFGYDKLNRLTSATAVPAVQGNTAYSWTYDSFGNRLTQSGDGGSNIWTKSENDTSGMPHNQVTQTNARGITWTPDYDASGNMQTDGANRYLYDADGHVCAVGQIGVQGGIQYIYNAAGQRVARGSIATLSCDTASNGFVATSQYLLGPGGGQMTEFTVDPGGAQTWVHTNVNAGGLLATCLKASTSSPPQVASRPPRQNTVT